MNWTGTIKPINVELPDDLHRAMKTAAPARNLTVKDAYAEALTAWLDLDKSKPTDGEFIKCPTQFREFINTMINRLMELSPDEIPEIRKLMIRFTEPGHIQQIIEEEERRTLRPRAVSNKK